MFLRLANAEEVMVSQKVLIPVIPAEAGIHNILKELDARFREHDKKCILRLFTRPSQVTGYRQKE